MAASGYSSASTCENSISFLFYFKISIRANQRKMASSRKKNISREGTLNFDYTFYYQVLSMVLTSKIDIFSLTFTSYYL